jgi:hypothetical protein
MVVSVEEKAGETCQVWIKKVSDKRTNVNVETSLGGVKIGVCPLLQDKSGGSPADCPDGTRRRVGTSLIRAVS